MSVHLNGLRSSTLLGPATTQIASQKMKLLNLVSFITREICKYQSGYWSQSRRSVRHMAAPNLPELRIFSSKSPWASAPNKVVVFHCDLGIQIPLLQTATAMLLLGCFSYLLHLHKALNTATSSTRSWSFDSTICVVGLVFYCRLSINNWCWN